MNIPLCTKQPAVFLEEHKVGITTQLTSSLLATRWLIGYPTQTFIPSDAWRWSHQHTYKVPETMTRLSRRYTLSTNIIKCVHEVVEKPCYYRCPLNPEGSCLGYHNTNGHHCSNANFPDPDNKEAPGGAGWLRWWRWHTTKSLQRTHHVVYWLIGKPLKCNHHARCLTRIMGKSNGRLSKLLIPWYAIIQHQSMFT